MRNGFKYYLPCWAVALIIFNTLTFAVPESFNENKFTPAFWVGYAFITVMFLIQLICSIIFFNQDAAEDEFLHHLNKTFLNVPVVSISYTGLVVSIIVGGVAMVVPFIPVWLGAIIDACVAAFYIIAVVSAKAAADTIGKVDEKIKTQTFFIKSLTVGADTLVAGAKSEETKAIAKKVYEAIRYSDPMSNPALANIETQISIKYGEFSNAINCNNAPLAQTLGNDLIVLINSRNNQCKLLK